MSATVIGVDPHKRSHTAVVVDDWPLTAGAKPATDIVFDATTTCASG
jgi:hypothetical protein